MSNKTDGGGGGGTFVAQALKRNEKLLTRLLALPFHQELRTDSLSTERFKHCCQQDIHWIDSYAQMLGIAVSKCDTTEQREFFTRMLDGFSRYEAELYRPHYFERLGMGDGSGNTSPSPSLHHYQCYLASLALKESWPVLASAMLTTFLVYRRIGMEVEKCGTMPKGSLFEPWVSSISDEQYKSDVCTFASLVDEMAERAGEHMVARMGGAIDMAMQLELAMWQSHYEMAQWQSGNE